MFQLVMNKPMLEVVREGGATSVFCTACVIECESTGKTTVEALMSLPCSHYQMDKTVDAKEERDARR